MQIQSLFLCMVLKNILISFFTCSCLVFSAPFIEQMVFFILDSLFVFFFSRAFGHFIFWFIYFYLKDNCLQF